MQKIRKVPCTDFLQNLKSLICGPVWTPFGPKTAKKVFPKKSPCSVISLYVAVTSCKKLHALIFDNTLKSSFWAHIGPFLAQELQKRAISQKIICVDLWSLCCNNFIHKSEMVHALTFDNT